MPASIFRWSAAAFRWPGFGFSLPTSIFRWPGFDFSYLTARGFRLFDFVVDDVLFTVITVLESLALAAMLCFFFVFCGCTL
ncbi:hypothetical protein EUGRSUZ_H04070 [Eucalyptus grandis]|uniref:Uncharacterized protein n=3 Tax=Eucalyptus TaxID=3932 RepID=A0ACC3JWW7_EUCGR|nr:hypothetical protein EUGRSUZ_H04070 [Eucalyptus grandis]